MGDVFVFDEEEEEKEDLTPGVSDPSGVGGKNPAFPPNNEVTPPPSPSSTGEEKVTPPTSPRGTGEGGVTPPPSPPPSPRSEEPTPPPSPRPEEPTPPTTPRPEEPTPPPSPRPEEDLTPPTSPRSEEPTPPTTPRPEEQADEKIVTPEEPSLTNDPRNVANLEDKFFEILGEKTQTEMAGKMSTRGDDKNQEPTKKDKSKTYGHLNESDETPLSAALENRQTVIKRANSDYTKEGAEKNEDKIKARQEAADKACEEFSKVLQAHEKKTEPTVEGQKFKVGGRLELDMDDKNQIAFPEDLGKKVGFSASLYFADESGKPMEEDNAVYLILSYKKGKISHIQAPSGLKTAEDGRAYVERDGNKYYARVSAENIETLRKESEKARTEAINAAKAAEKEKEKAEEVVVVNQEPVAEVQSTKTAEKNDPAAMAANAPIKPRPGVWGRVDEAKNENDNEVTQLNVTVSTQMENQIDLDDALLEAAKRGDNQVATELIEKGANVNTQAEELECKMTPLMHAASGGHVNTVDLLLKEGANQDMLDMYGDTALICAARATSSVSTLQALINGGADVNIVNGEGKTALMFAAANGQVEIAQALLDSHAKVNAQTNDELKTPLMHAVSKALDEKEIGNKVVYTESLKTVGLLVSNGADVNAKDKDGNTALTMAAAGQSKRTVDALLTGNVSLDNVTKALEVANDSEGPKKKVNSIVTALKKKQKELGGQKNAGVDKLRESKGRDDSALKRQQLIEENEFRRAQKEAESKTPTKTERMNERGPVFKIPEGLDPKTPTSSRPNSLNNRELPPIGGDGRDRGVDTKEILNFTRDQKIEKSLNEKLMGEAEAQANEAEGQEMINDYNESNKGQDSAQESKRALNAARKNASAIKNLFTQNGNEVPNQDSLISPPKTPKVEPEVKLGKREGQGQSQR